LQICKQINKDFIIHKMNYSNNQHKKQAQFRSKKCKKLLQNSFATAFFR